MDFHMNQSQASSKISRRDVLKGFCVGAVSTGLAMGLNIRPAIAQTSEDGIEMVSAFYRTHVGDLEVTVMQDGVFALPTSLLVVNAPEEDVVAVLQDHHMATDMVPLPIGIVMIKSGERRVLVDAGDGLSGFAGDNTGKLLSTLGLLGISPEDITDVVISHYHPDHIGGVSIDGNIAFPNAQYYLPQIEWDYLQAGDFTEFLTPFAGFANSKLEPVAANDGQLVFYDGEEELAPGIQTFSALGHSIGHHGLMLESNGQQLMLAVDAIVNPVLSVQHPDWFAGVDQIPDVTVATRHTLLARLADEQLPFLGYHFPFPGIGNIIRSSAGYHYIPTG